MRNPFRRRNWKQTEATVFSCGFQDEIAAGTVGNEYLIVFSYEIDGEWYSGEYTTSAALPEKSTFPLRYDADDPAHNEYSIAATMNTLPVKIATYILALVLVVLYEWLRGRAHH